MSVSLPRVCVRSRQNMLFVLFTLKVTSKHVSRVERNARKAAADNALRTLVRYTVSHGTQDAFFFLQWVSCLLDVRAELVVMLSKKIRHAPRQVMSLRINSWLTTLVSG